MVCWSRVPGEVLSAWTSSRLPSNSKVSSAPARLTPAPQAASVSGLHVCLLSTGSSPAAGVSPLKTLLPLSSSSLHALTCQDATLHTLALPLYGKSSCVPPLAGTAFSSLGTDRLRGLPPLSPLTDLPLLSVLQGKKAPVHCRDPCLHGSPASPPCLIPIRSPLSPQGPASSLLPHLSDAAGPFCLYRYSFPLNPQLTAISRHVKLAEDTTDCLLRQPPWQPATSHCL